MDVLSAKRRKLDHHRDDAISANGNTATDAEEMKSQSSLEAGDNLSRNPTTPKHPHSRPNYAHDTDEGALYAGRVYKSSIFKLQVDEMLAEVQPNYEKQMSWIEDALHKLNDIIGGIEERGPLPVSLCPQCLEGHTHSLDFRSNENAV